MTRGKKPGLFMNTPNQSFSLAPFIYLFIYFSLPCFATLLFCCSFCAPLHRYSLTSLLPCFENIFHNQQSSLAPSLAILFFTTSLFCCSLFRYSLLLYLLTLLHPCFITIWFIAPFASLHPLLHCSLALLCPSFITPSPPFQVPFRVTLVASISFALLLYICLFLV